MPTYAETYKKYRYKGAFIFPVPTGPHKGEYKVTGISIQRKYYPTRNQARAAIDKWEKSQYKKDKRKFD